MSSRESVFIAWSGPSSGMIADSLHGWLDNVVPEVCPFTSSRNIVAGGRWFAELSGVLARARYAVLCMTPDNLDSAWLHFEAGACAKVIEESRVCPLLFDVKASDLRDPLAQFQGRLLDREGMDWLTRDLNKSLPEPADESKRQKRFDKWWPDLENRLVQVRSSRANAKQQLRRNDSELLEEAVELLRQLRRLVADPSAILPATYLGQVLSDIRKADQNGYQQLVQFIKDRKEAQGTGMTIVPGTNPHPA